MASVGTRCLVTLDEVRDYLKASSTDDDEMLAQFADSATAAIEVYTKRKLVSRTYDGGANNEPKMVLSGRGSSEISFREFPVTAVTAAVVRYDDGVTTRTLNITGARLLHGGRRLWLPFDSFDEGQSNVEITCVAGYSEAVHPSEVRTLKLACLRWSQVMWQDHVMAVGRGANIAVGGESVSVIGDAIPKDIALMLRPFERWF